MMTRYVHHTFNCIVGHPSQHTDRELELMCLLTDISFRRINARVIHLIEDGCKLQFYSSAECYNYLKSRYDALQIR